MVGWECPDVETEWPAAVGKTPSGESIGTSERRLPLATVGDPHWTHWVSGAEGAEAR